MGKCVVFSLGFYFKISILERLRLEVYYFYTGIYTSTLEEVTELFMVVIFVLRVTFDRELSI